MQGGRLEMYVTYQPCRYEYLPRQARAEELYRRKQLFILIVSELSLSANFDNLFPE